MKSYQFAILRYVNNTSTEEFVNIGIIMWLPADELFLFEINKRYGRISEFYSDFDSMSYRQMITHLLDHFTKIKQKTNRIQFDLLEKEKTIIELRKHLYPEDSSCLQWSRIMSGITKNPEKRLNKLFYEFVKSNEKNQLRERRDETDIWNNVLSRLQEKELDKRVKQNLEIASNNFTYNFKMGWTNGVQQVLEPISFDLKSSTRIIDKANTWAGRLFTLSQEKEFKMTAVIATSISETKDGERGRDILYKAPCIREVIHEQEVESFLGVIENEIYS